MVQTGSRGIRFRGRSREHIELTLQDESPLSRSPPPPLRKRKLQTTGGRLVQSEISRPSTSSAPTVCRRLLPPPSSSEDFDSNASTLADDEPENLSPLSILPFLLSHQVIPSSIILDFASYFPLLVPDTLLHVHRFTVATLVGKSSLPSMHCTSHTLPLVLLSVLLQIPFLFLLQLIPLFLYYSPQISLCMHLLFHLLHQFHHLTLTHPRHLVDLPLPNALFPIPLQGGVAVLSAHRHPLILASLLLLKPSVLSFLMMRRRITGIVLLIEESLVSTASITPNFYTFISLTGFNP